MRNYLSQPLSLLKRSILIENWNSGSLLGRESGQCCGVKHAFTEAPCGMLKKSEGYLRVTLDQNLAWTFNLAMRMEGLDARELGKGLVCD